MWLANKCFRPSSSTFNVERLLSELTNFRLGSIAANNNSETSPDITLHGQSGTPLRSSLQRISHHFRHILRQAFDGSDALQRGARMRLPAGVELAPAVEATGDA